MVQPAPGMYTLLERQLREIISAGRPLILHVKPSGQVLGWYELHIEQMPKRDVFLLLNKQNEIRLWKNIETVARYIQGLVGDVQLAPILLYEKGNAPKVASMSFKVNQDT